MLTETANVRPSRMNTHAKMWSNPNLLKMGIFFGRIGVVKPHDQLSLEGQLVVLVQEGGLGMTYVKITGEALRREESRH